MAFKNQCYIESFGILKLLALGLKLGDKGERVKQLQDALKSENFNCSTSDGDFGPATLAAVKNLQSQKTGLAIDGVYNKATHDLLFELMNE